MSAIDPIYYKKIYTKKQIAWGTFSYFTWLVPFLLWDLIHQGSYVDALRADRDIWMDKYLKLLIQTSRDDSSQP